MNEIITEQSQLTVAQIKEAVNRMKKLGLHENAIKEFSDERKLNKSCYCKIGKAKIGSLYWLNDEEQKMVKEIEDEYNIVVYHVIESNTDFGRLLTMLYVSDSSDEWELDDELFDSNCQYAYVKNLDDDMCSEFGAINYQKACGGLIRTA